MKIKQLEFNEYDTAYTPVGVYSLFCDMDGYGWCYLYNDSVQECFLSMKQASEKCQKDFERRVTECFVSE